MHRKVNIWLALAVILIVAGVFAWVISARAITPGMAISVLAPPVKCVLDPCPGPGCAGLCQASCQTCGSLAGLCNGLFEVKAKYRSGSPVLYIGAGGPALCLATPVPPNGGAFIPGATCFGNVIGVGPHFIPNFVCSTSVFKNWETLFRQF